ncbi:hypothetical protein EXIGLDRAFT_722764 [Exidia glandulosa HHB12029]|uniref:VPS37 C-terminal domain-containing protein n=1 Tax=Exidia glandulosa HHB12029 TaxID=1314781 RepID=A0A165F4R2_EXIGL|nr:hypothetical protein EXIGLDRAFT_722764 [Exidia glandulosa HHB12029]
MSTSELAAEFPQVAVLPRDALEDLLNDAQYLQAIVHTLPQAQQITQAQAELGSANEALAQRNVALQEPLMRVRQETQAAFDEARALEARWRVLEREQRDLYQRYSQGFLMMRLRHATTAQDELSEAVATKFVRGEGGGTGPGDVDAFVKEFREMRTAYHKRAIWSERWASGQVSWPDDN